MAAGVVAAGAVVTGAVVAGGSHDGSYPSPPNTHPTTVGPGRASGPHRLCCQDTNITENVVSMAGLPKWKSQISPSLDA